MTCEGFEKETLELLWPWVLWRCWEICMWDNLCKHGFQGPSYCVFTMVRDLRVEGFMTKLLRRIITPDRRRSLCCPRSRSGRLSFGWKAHSVGPRGWMPTLILYTSSVSFFGLLLYMFYSSCTLATLVSEWGYASALTLCDCIFFWSLFS